MVQGVARHLDLQGHRGARGLMPENTLPGFAAALSIGVTTIELDAAVTADGVVVASHDRRLNPDLTRRGNGLWLSRPGPDIHSLTLGALRGYDVGRIKPGSAYADEFPAQAGWDGIAIPTLDEVIGLTEAAGNARVRFNVEIKSSPLEPAATLPPERYASAVLETLDRLGVGERSTLQSFDWRASQWALAQATDVRISCLSVEQSRFDTIERAGAAGSPWTAGLEVGEHDGSIPRLLDALGVAVWSPFHGDLTDRDLAEAHRLGLEVVVWTANEPSVMRALIERGVDGIITDYPDRLREVVLELGLPVPEPTPVAFESG